MCKDRAVAFLELGELLGQLYKDYQLMILQNHIFRCIPSMIHLNKVIVECRQSLLPEDLPVLVNVIKMSYHT
jgi:hypothetical protein